MKRSVGLVAVWVLATSGAVLAQETPAQQPTAFTLRQSLKSSGLFSLMPDDPLLFPDRGIAEGLWRYRVEPALRLSDDMSFDAAVEQRIHAFSSFRAFSGVLPVEGQAPYRIRQLDWELAAGAYGQWHLEIDRAALHMNAGAVTLTAGRQAIGWGRGVLFGAIDLFSPFSPLEADREWRRGVDAVRANVKLADRTSLDAVSAFGTDIDHSAFAARWQTDTGKADLEIAGGRRARDVFIGGATSAPVGPAELHGEFAVFDTPTDVVTKVVAGGSYRIPVGNGLLWFFEYHYSGFGAASPEQIVPMLADPAFQERYLRGDTQILGRHAIASLVSYESSPEWTYGLQWLQSPVDASGIVMPQLTRTFSDQLSFFFSGYVPYGRAPIGAVFMSEYGVSPLAAFIQLRLYR